MSWKSKKQPTIAESTCESEYIAANFAFKEGIFLQQMMLDLNHPKIQIKLHIDNQGTIDLSKNPVKFERSKHILIKFHFIRSKVEDKTVSLIKIGSKDNFADLYTKPAVKTNLHMFLMK